MLDDVQVFSNPLTSALDDKIVEDGTEQATAMLMLECDEHDGVIQIFNEDECE